jgi:hypothetical protein
MRLATRAWALREAARTAVVAGDAVAALEHAQAAYALAHTPRATRLLALALVTAGRATEARELIRHLDSC